MFRQARRQGIEAHRARGRPPPAVARIRRALDAALLTALAIVWLTGAMAQAPQTGAPTSDGVTSIGEQPLSADWIQGQIREVESDQTIPDAVRPKVVQMYRDALRATAAAEAHRQAAAAYGQVVQRAAAQAAAPTSRVPSPSAAITEVPATAGITERTPVTDIEQRLLKEETALVAIGRKAEAIERQLVFESGRPAASRTELLEAREALLQLEAESALAPAAGEVRAATEARRTLNAARRAEQRARIDRIEQEILSYGPRLQVLNAEKGSTDDAQARQSARVDELEALLFARRSADAKEAEAAARRALEQVVTQYPPLQAVAERNVDLGQSLATLNERTRAAGQEREQKAKALAAVASTFDRLRPQLATTGGDAPIGEALLVYRERLVRMASEQARLGELLDEVSSLGFDLHRTEDERQALADLEAATDRLLTETGLATLPAAEKEAARAAVRRLLSDQRSLLDKVLAAAQANLRELSDLATTIGQLDARVEEFRTAIDARLLWSRTLPRFGWATFRELPGATMRLFGLDAWSGFARALAHTPLIAGVIALLALSFAAAMLFARRSLVGAIAAIAARTPASMIEGMRLTLRAMALTALLAVPLALALFAPGWLALASRSVDGRALGIGFVAAGLFWLYAEATRQVFRRGGLAEAHFGWPTVLGTRVWKEFRWSVPLTAALVFVGATAAAGTVPDRHSLGRLAYAAVGGVWALVAHRVLRHDRAAGRPPVHGQRLWHVLGVAFPGLFALLPLLGYGFTAVALGTRAEVSFWLVGAILLAYGLATRLLSLHREELARRAADPGTPPTENLDEMDRRTRFLLRGAVDFALVIGLWWTWSRLLPVLSGSARFQLWTKTALVAGVEQRVPVTLGDVLLAVIIVALTVVGVRNVPGALQILMQRMVRSDASLRVAFSTVAQYLIIGFGTVSALGILGADWSKLQWLVAALGVGLGFGLQEIVANFVCGLIILFERPVRAGDVVTVGDVTGTVTRISIRATHITDFDKKSVVVPNKSLITDKVTNWTLSDQMTRLLMTVGVAYGSDPVQVQRIILEATRNLPGVVMDPPPSVLFVRFGESSLDFEARMYVGHMDDRLPTMHAFHIAVERALRENGIEIPFPQRDLHIRTLPEGLRPAPGART